jgi:hypothetical protein
MNELAAKSPQKKGITNTPDFSRAKEIVAGLRKK